MIATTALPACHSKDYYVRLKRRELEGLVLEHWSSHVESNTPLGGYTEWTSMAGGVVVSVSWEWQRQDDGALVIVPPRSILSNLMVISDQGYDMGMVGTEKALQEWLEGLSWGETVRLALPERCSTRH